MTLDEAIKHAEEVADRCEYEATRYDTTDHYECYMAGEQGRCGEQHRQLAEWLKDYKQLLEQEPCEDAVSRQAVLDMATTIQTDDYSGNETVEVVDVDDVRALPSVTPTTNWIPVSERLPKRAGDYLVTLSLDMGTKKPVREVHKDYFCLSRNWLYYEEDVIAWQPLPEVYKVESEVEHDN